MDVNHSASAAIDVGLREYVERSTPSAMTAELWRQVYELARTNPVAAQVIAYRHHGVGGEHAALAGFVAAIETVETMHARLVDLMNRLPPPPERRPVNVGVANPEQAQ
jgi:hypothetical protein